jgi:hypothetical protein
MVSGCSFLDVFAETLGTTADPNELKGLDGKDKETYQNLDLGYTKCLIIGYTETLARILERQNMLQISQVFIPEAASRATDHLSGACVAHANVTNRVRTLLLTVALGGRCGDDASGSASREIFATGLYDRRGRWTKRPNEYSNIRDFVFCLEVRNLFIRN